VEVRYEDQDFDLPNGSVVAIGTFDGVHVGHRAVLGEALAIAHELGATSVAAIPDRHPASVVRPETAPRLLTDLHYRIELLASTGVELCFVLRFDEERSLQEPEDFVREIIAGRLRAKALVVGEDFHFGRRRRGDTAVLADLEPVFGFKVIGLPLVSSDAAAGVVSATAVREALARGDVGAAQRMLGRAHEVHGVVEHGDHRGRTIGFPTANVAVPGDIALPTDGVYAGWYELPSGEVRQAAINLGKRPTFYDHNGMRLLEAHLLDFDGDLYGQHARVRFQQWLRGEVKFPSVDALVERLRKDVDATRAALSQ
jgi:riboflavin kinase / FMN adenylyltransferase